MTKTWLITGSPRGSRRELAKAVLASGDRAIATARGPERLDDLVHQYGDLVRTAPLDVTDPVAADAAVQLAIDEFGRVVVGAGVRAWARWLDWRGQAPGVTLGP